MWNGIGEEPRPARPTPFGETGEVRRKTGEAVVSGQVVLTFTTMQLA